MYQNSHILTTYNICALYMKFIMIIYDGGSWKDLRERFLHKEMTICSTTHPSSFRYNHHIAPVIPWRFQLLSRSWLSTAIDYQRRQWMKGLIFHLDHYLSVHDMTGVRIISCASFASETFCISDVPKRVAILCKVSDDIRTGHAFVAD